MDYNTPRRGVGGPSKGEALKRLVREYAILLGLAGIIVALDQWTKWLVRTNLPLEATWLPAWLSWLSPYATNRALE